jgi:anti-anti-sigma factor
LEPAVVRRDGGVAVVSLQGEIDIVTEPEVTAVFSEVLESWPLAVVVDLSRVSFMDCAGFHALGVLQTKGRWIGVDAFLAAVPVPVTRLLDPLGLTGVFSTAATVEQAAEAARESAWATLNRDGA